MVAIPPLVPRATLSPSPVIGLILPNDFTAESPVRLARIDSNQVRDPLRPVRRCCPPADFARPPFLLELVGRVDRLNKAALVQRLARFLRARGCEVARDDVRAMLEEIERLCHRELAESGEFSIPKIAKIVIERRAPRTGRHPNTGEPMPIPARNVVRARVSSVVERALGLAKSPAGRGAAGARPVC